MVNILGTSYMMAYFMKHSYMHQEGTQQDKNFSNYLVKNFAKGVLITNALLLMFYLTRFRTYRNSNLLKWHLPASFSGIYLGVYGTQPIFDAYLFERGEFSHAHAL